MLRIKKAAVVLLAFLVTGCGAIQEEAPKTENIITSMEAEPELSYEVPASSANIFVNQLGYIKESTKVAVFCGKELPEEFQVIRRDTGEVVFTGCLENKGYDDGSKEYNSYGDFSGVCEAGVYYIEAPLVGRSYSFTIEDGLYERIFKEACKQYYYNRCGMTLTKQYANEVAHNACHTGKAVLKEDESVSLDVSGGWHQDEKGSKKVDQAAKSIGIMLLSYELYGDSFTDEMGIPESGNGVPDLLDEIKYEIEWLLKMQDKETGAVYSGVGIYEKNGGEGIYVEPAGQVSSLAFAAALSKFSYLYQEYNEDYAVKCLEAAERAWQYADSDQGDKETEEWRFAAATELYRATGKQSVHKYVTRYLSGEAYGENMSDMVFWGCVTYICTRQSVKLELCEEIAGIFMQRAEEIAQEAAGSLFLAGGGNGQKNNQELLQNMMYLTTVDHMITNHEYDSVIENHLHYFLGRNEKAISYIDNVGERNYRTIDESMGIMKQFDANSKLVFMLSEIVGEHHH